MDTRANFDRLLQDLQKEILYMGSMVEKAIKDAVTSLASTDTKLAQKIIDQDNEVDEMMLNIENHCVALIALQQPIAGDLRAITTTFKIVTDLERIADYAVDIAKTTLQLSGERLLKPLVDTPRMAEMAIDMLQESLLSYTERNTSRANRIAEKEKEVDRLYATIFQELIELMETEKSTNRQVAHLLMVIRYIERVADHATNIGEWTIYMVNGKRNSLNP
jgi:phosphate transport system protein